ncbi:MAG: DNA polymerase IV [Acidimicrobiales bacterium]|nr:DNA polymerase IV [Acidimicrobiales bacterium]
MPDGAEQRWILHADMDAFFASVEALDDPALAGRPLIVGGAGPRGVVASCSYEARVFGVRSAMPSSRARRLCPDAVFVAGRYDRYSAVSSEMHSVFRRFTPLVEGISLDEAFLDVTGSVRLFGPAPEMAAAIRETIRDELHLSCSVGVAPVKFLAKLASEAAKPRAGPAGPLAGRGVVVIRPGEELRFLHPLPIEALWGVGPATADRLHRRGLNTVGDLARLPRHVLEAAVGRAHGGLLADLARGLDERLVEPGREVKSVSHEETYPADRYDPDELHTEIVRMADAVAARVRRAGLAGRTVNLKIRYGDFSTRTRSITSPHPVDSGPAIAALASSLLSAVDLSPGVRLLGVGVSNLGPVADDGIEQLALDLVAPSAGAERGPARRAADVSASAAVDAVRSRFGPASVGPAALLGPAGLRVKRPGESQWGPQTGGSGGAADAKGG